MRRVLANVQISAGLYDRALENAQTVLAIDPTFPYVGMFRARALLFKGQRTEALRWLEAQGPDVHGYLGYAYAVSGRRAEAEALARRSEDPDHQGARPGDDHRQSSPHGASNVTLTSCSRTVGPP